MVQISHGSIGNGDRLLATLCPFSVMPAIIFMLSLNFESEDAPCGLSPT